LSSVNSIISYANWNANSEIQFVELPHVLKQNFYRNESLALTLASLGV